MCLCNLVTRLQGLVQDAHEGYAHRVWQAAQELADARDVDFVQFSILGQPALVAASPEAVDCIVKRNDWMPKWAQARGVFCWMVRSWAVILNAHLLRLLHSAQSDI